MARPIKETPTLVGADAQLLASKIDNPRTVCETEVIEARQAYESMMRMAQFNF